MSELAVELRKLRVGLEGGRTDDDFVARVMAACESESAAAPKPRPRAWRSYTALVSVAACLALGVAIWPRGEQPRETVAARGTIDQGLGATVQAFVGHTAEGSAPPLLDGATLRPGDGILVRYSNPTPKELYLMVFALDEQGAVHWIHPAYLSEDTNPTSLRLSPLALERVLPEVAEPEGAAAGRLRVYALLSQRALDVKSVERKVDGAEPDVAAIFPEAEVEQWSCTWAP